MVDRVEYILFSPHSIYNLQKNTTSYENDKYF